MWIRAIEIENFRGIKKINWENIPQFCCLIGPGNSRKTTILKAINWALYPNQYLNVSDLDFFDADINNVISIKLTISDVPNDLLNEAIFGLYLRGFKDGLVIDEPIEGSIPVITINLKIDNELSPAWYLYVERDLPEKVIPASIRKRLGAYFAGENIDSHLNWGRGSPLLSLLPLKGKEVATAFKEISRNLSSEITPEALASFNATASDAKTKANSYGVIARVNYTAQIEFGINSLSQSSLSLFENKIPLRLSGSGTKKLISIAMQREMVADKGILLFDEIEHGLEPHRIRALLKKIESELTLQTLEQPLGQIIWTSHSPIVLQEMSANQISVTRADQEGKITVKNLNIEFQKILRSGSEAFFANKILVCEGKTEVGIIKTMAQFWKSRGRSPLESVGGYFIEGGGSNSIEIAKTFKLAGYDVSLFLDNDDGPTRIKCRELQDINVFAWTEEVSTDERFFLDLPFGVIPECISKIIDRESSGFELLSIVQSINSRLPNDSHFSIDLHEWEASHNSVQHRTALGKTAKIKSWYKRIDFGEELGSFIVDNYEEIIETDLRKKIDLIEAWFYA